MVHPSCFILPSLTFFVEGELRIGDCKRELELACFYKQDDTFCYFIFVAGIVFGFEVVAEHLGEGLETVGDKLTFIKLYHGEGCASAFAIDKLHQHLALPCGHVAKLVFVLVVKQTLVLFPELALLPSRHVAHNLVGANHFLMQNLGNRQCLLHVSHSAPIEFLLPFVLKVHGRKDVDIAQILEV